MPFLQQTLLTVFKAGLFASFKAKLTASFSILAFGAVDNKNEEQH
jgi:hypothetical protein